MANAIYKTVASDTLQKVAEKFYAVADPDGTANDGNRRMVIAAIRSATPTAVLDLTLYTDSATLPTGSTVFVPTLRQFSRALLVTNSTILTDLQDLGIRNARSLLTRDMQAVSDTLPKVGYTAADVQRAYVMTAFFNLDGMDDYSAEYLYDDASTGFETMAELAEQSTTTLASVLDDMVTAGRPAELDQQQHEHRWLLEAKVLSRPRITQRQRVSFHGIPSAVSQSQGRAEHYERLITNVALDPADTEAATVLAHSYRFQEALTRGNIALAAGRWRLAIQHLFKARRIWHIEVERQGVVSNVDDDLGVNLEDSIKTLHSMLTSLPAETTGPLDAPEFRAFDERANQRKSRFGLRAFRYDELTGAQKTAFRAESGIAARRVRDLPGPARKALRRAILAKSRRELTRANPRLASGLRRGDNETLGRDVSAEDRQTLARNLGSSRLDALFPDSGSEELDLIADAEVQSKLTLADFASVAGTLWSSGTAQVSTLLETAALDEYPSSFQTNGPFTRFLRLPALEGEDEDQFVVFDSSNQAAFVTAYRDDLLKPRLKSKYASDVSFEDACYDSSTCFTALLPFHYCVTIPLALRQAFLSLGEGSNAMLFGGLRVNAYNTAGTLLVDRAAANPGSLLYDPGLALCETDFDVDGVVYQGELQDYVHATLRDADKKYMRDHRRVARKQYNDALCAIEKGAPKAYDDSYVTMVPPQGDDTPDPPDLTGLLTTWEDPPGTTHTVMGGVLAVTQGAREATTLEQGVANNDATFAWATAEPPSATNITYGTATVVLFDTALTEGTSFGSDLTLEVVEAEDFEFQAWAFEKALYCRAKIAAIDAGLNWFGFPDHFVPAWSFDHLYGVARDLSNRALEAESRVFTLLGMLDSAVGEQLAAEDQIELAGMQLAVSEAQVAEARQAKRLAIKQANIASEQADLAQSQNNLSGWMNLGAGLVTATVGLFSPSPATSVAGMAQMASGIGQLSKNSAYDDVSDLNKQAADLTREHGKARVAVATAQRDVAAIAEQQAKDLLEFLKNKKLSAKSIRALLANGRELADFYLEHANRMAWMAERALAHSTRRPFRSVQTVYYARSEINRLMRAQELTADLESLRSDYIAGQTQRMQEVKWTIPLSALSAGALDGLRTTGKCTFMVPQELVDMYFPGMYLHSLQDMKLTFIGALPPNGPRGTLRNSGVTWVRVPNNSDYTSNGASTTTDWVTTGLAGTQYGDDSWDDWNGYTMKRLHTVGTSLALSQFDVQGDRAVLSLPQGLLRAVQNLGMDNLWLLELHRQANAFDYTDISDIEFTFFFRAEFDKDLADAQFEALVRRGLAGNLGAAHVTSFATDSTDAFDSLVAQPADTEALDLRYLVVDVSGLSPWETSRALYDAFVGFERLDTNDNQLTVRVHSAAEPLGVALTTAAGRVFSDTGNDFASLSPSAAFTDWIHDHHIDGATGDDDPAQRFVLKFSPNHIESTTGDWTVTDEDGVQSKTTSGALEGEAAATAVYDDGGAWTDYRVRVKVKHNGGTLGVQFRRSGDGTDFYELQISPDDFKLFETTTTPALDELTFPSGDGYPASDPVPDEFLLVEINCWGSNITVFVDHVQVLSATDTNYTTGTIALRAVSGGTGAQFDDVEVTRLTKLGNPAEALHTERFTTSIPSDWTTTGTWAINSGGHPLLDLSGVVNATFKLDYKHEMSTS